MSGKNGFSLVELLIVIVILGILVAIGIPSMSGFVRKGRIENQTKRTYSDLMNVRIMAMNRNMTHFVRFGTSPYGVFADIDGDGVYDAGSDTRVLSRSGPDKPPSPFFNATINDEAVTTNLGNQASFNSRGIAIIEGTICVAERAVSFQPSVNCIVVNRTRIRLGVVTTGPGAICDADNCRQLQ
jgi:prepilin-type N-terminal cleavage/methylation domain-containing protein